MRNLISIIIPVYRVENYLKDCLNSVIHQTYTNLEVILIDDGSPDNSGKICDEYAVKDSRIKVIHKKNGGVSSARNVGLDNASGDWICFLDPDDWIELNTIEIVLCKLIETHTELCFFDFIKIYKKKNEYSSTLKVDNEVFTDLKDINNFKIYMSHTECCNFIVKSELIDIRFDEKLTIGEDTIFKFQLYSKLNNFSYLKKGLYNYRMLENSSTGKMNYNLPEIILYRHKIMSQILKKAKYPLEANIIPNTIELIRGLPDIVKLAFNDSLSVRCDYNIISKYINTEEFQEARHNYDKQLAGRCANCYLIFEKLNRLNITFIYLIYKLHHLIGFKRRI